MIFHVEGPQTEKEEDYSTWNGQRQTKRTIIPCVRARDKEDDLFHVEGPKTDKEEDCSHADGLNNAVQYPTTTSFCHS